jgi:hypothetical protein
MRITHSKGGEFESLTPGIIEVLFVVIPLLNTVFIFMLLPYIIKMIDIKLKYKEPNTSKFFKIKK